MSGIWSWIGSHQLLMKWLSGAGAALLLIGGVALGASRTSPPQSTLAEAALQAQPVAARVPVGPHSVVGVIRAVGPSEILVRSARGMFVAVKWGSGSHFRAAGQQIKPATLQPGDRVVIIGSPAADGSLAASRVTLIPRPADREGGAAPAGP